MTHFFAHPTALVESDRIGEETRIWAFAHVMQGAQVGSNCNLGNHVFVEAGAMVGDNVTIKNNVCVWEGVTLEDGVFVGPNVTFSNDRHPRSARLPEAADRYQLRQDWLLPTIVEHGCSIGAAATLLPGICVGRYSMIAAGAVVTRSVEPFALMVGTPARQAGWVCRCGQPIEAKRTNTMCRCCGRTPEIHFSLLTKEMLQQ